MNLMLAAETAAEVTRGEILTVYYLIPFIALLVSFGLNYMLGAMAVNRLVKRHMPGIGEKLCFLPFVRYYYVGKLAFSGKFSKKGLSWVGVAFPIVRGIEVIVDLVSNAITTTFVYACNVDIVSMFQADELGLDWQYDLEGKILPSWTSYLNTVSLIAFWVSIVLAAILFINFFRRFKTRQGVLFGILSLIFIDGIFLFVCRNNSTVEEEVDRMRAAMNNQPPYGNPYGNPYQNQNFYGQNPYQGNPYGQNSYQGNPYGQNPYQGNQSPYGQTFTQGNQNPYGQGNPNPYATPNHPYGQNGTSFGEPQHPNEQPGEPFSEFGGNGVPPTPQSGEPFSEFDNPDNKNQN